MAEVYWDLEWTMMQQGFDYAYDKRLYDRLHEGHARPVREHFLAGLDYQNRLARFMENHDEPRAAAAFPPGKHEAAAVLTYLSPGLRFFHQGQLEGRRKRISPHLVRAPDRAGRRDARRFYDGAPGGARGTPTVRDGQWSLLECAPAWDGNGTWDGFIAFAWQGGTGRRVLVDRELRAEPGPVLRPPAVEETCAARRCGSGTGWAPRSTTGAATTSAARGLYLDVPAWGYHVFEVGRLVMATCRRHASDRSTDSSRARSLSLMILCWLFAGCSAYHHARARVRRAGPSRETRSGRRS